MALSQMPEEELDKPVIIWDEGTRKAFTIEEGISKSPHPYLTLNNDLDAVIGLIISKALD